MIAVVDYRAGNLASVAAALRAVGGDCQVTADPAVIRRAERVVFPGVGAAGAAMGHLRTLGLVEPLRAVLAAGTPFLGICLGYQVLFEYSEEDDAECLGIVPGRVVRFADSLCQPDSGRALKIPHMGWNRVEFLRPHPVWADVPVGSEFYFVHSYYPVPATPADGCARTSYGLDFASGVARENLVAFQFHPEKSGRPGLMLLRNFCTWTP